MITDTISIHLSDESHLTFGKVATRSIAEIKKLESLGDQCEQLVSCSDISAKTVRGMSKRRKKIAIKRYTDLSSFYDTRTGILVNPYKVGRKYINYISLSTTFKETIGKPLVSVYDAWVAGLLRCP